MDTPSVARIVHLHDGANSPCRAAIVTAVHDMTVDVAVFEPSGTRNLLNVGYRAANAGQHPGITWHWPERV